MAFVLATTGFAQQHTITFLVDMNNVADPFTTPEVNGNFNGWCGGCAQMTDGNNDGIWQIDVQLEPGTYEYKFAYDSWAGQESLIPGSSCTITSNGFTNRSLVVTGDAVLPVVCWGACEPCESIVNYDVTFRVDMSQVAEPFISPEVNGSFNSWCGGCAPLSDTDGDDIWEITIPLQAGTYEYKFAFDSWSGQEALIPGSPCTITTDGFTNRLLTVSSDVTLDLVCWGSCEACQGGDLVDVTFRVDMNEVTAPFMTPEVNGSFNGWCGGCAPMSDENGDGVWELIIALPPGMHEYKFAYDAWAGQEELAPGGSCTITTGPFTNRVVEATSDVVLPIVCWGSCGACNDPQGPFNVLFSVDMNEVEEPFTTPEVNGTFNGWCGGCAPMSDADGDNVWELVIALPAGLHEYKFAYDSWAGQEELAAGSICTMTTDGFTNRVVNVAQDTDLMVVCWAQCGPCTINVSEVNKDTAFTLFPNPASDLLQLDFSTMPSSQLSVRVINLSGAWVCTAPVTGLRHNLDISGLANGLYMVQVISESGIQMKPFMVQR